jgi:predicted nuclease of predicted toxin-antitoxin system
MIRLLIDQGLPRSASALLREVGIEATHVGEAGLAQATDTRILQVARERNQVVVTLDADFHGLLALENASSPSVIRIRKQGLDARALAALIQQVFAACTDELRQGAAVTVHENRIRMRLLPLH